MNALVVALFRPALFFLKGGDGPEAQEYARRKGEYTTLEQENAARKGNLPQSPAIPPAVPSAPAMALVASAAPTLP